MTHEIQPVPGPPIHVVQFYDGARPLSAAVAKFVGDGLRAGDPAIVIATDTHRRAFLARLEADGIDVASAEASGDIVLLDAHETLARFMRAGAPDAAAFEQSVGKLVAESASRTTAPRRLRAYGEMVDVLWRQGDKQAALRLEELWNDLQRRHAFSLYCAYEIAGFYKEPDGLYHVCAQHSQVMPELSPDDPEPRSARDLAAEIARREEVEQALRQALGELRAKEKLLEQSEAQFRDLCENAPIGLHRVASDGTILWANRAELSLLGYSEQEYVGRSITEFHVDHDVIGDILARLGKGEELHDYEARLRAKDGSIKHVLISSNVYSKDGRFVHTRCFTRDITARRAAEAALRDREQQLGLITDALPGLIAYVDRDHRYRFVSAGYERWFGHSRRDLIGRHLRDVLGEDAYRVIQPRADQALAGTAVRWEAEIPYRDGGTRFVEASYVPQRGDDDAVVGFVSLVVDISERKAFERFRLATADRGEQLLRITAAIADAVKAEDVFAAVVDRTAEALGASSAGLWVVDDTNATATLVRSQGYAVAARDSLATLSLASDRRMPVTDALRTGKTVWIPSQEVMLTEYPDLREIATIPRGYRIAALPLVSNGNVIGALGLTIEHEGGVDADERAFLQLVAGYASQAIERLRLLEAERRSRALADEAVTRLGALARTSRTFADADLELQARVQAVATELGRTLDSCVNIALLDDANVLRIAGVHHPDAAAQQELRQLTLRAPIRLGEGITGTIAATGESALIPRIDPQQLVERAPAEYRDFLQRFPSHAMMGAALRARDRVIGTVTVARVRHGESYGPEDLAMLEDLAARAAAAIDNSRLYDETRTAHERAQHLYRFAQSVVAADHIESIYDAAMQTIAAALGSSRSAILTYENDDVMRFRAWRGLSDEYRAAVEGHSPWARDVHAPHPVLISDVDSEPSLASYQSLFRREAIRAIGFIPIVSDGTLLGKFMLYYDAPHAFEAPEIETAISVANHLGSVIARLVVVTKLEETVRYNELFAGVLAHDLRNPLGAIMMAAQVALMRREGESDRRDGQPISRILSSGQRMKTMIEQLLDFTRARSGGGIGVQPRPVDLGDLAAQAIGELEIMHPEWRIEIQVNGDASGAWDADRLLQVLSNLLSNAGQHGRIQDGIVVTLDGTQAERVVARVHNEGVIPANILPMLFDPFRTVRTGQRQSRGLGLGLFIVREIVRAHGGTVTVESTESAGTTFTIDLPRHADRRLPLGT